MLKQIILIIFFFLNNLQGQKVKQDLSVNENCINYGRISFYDSMYKLYIERSSDSLHYYEKLARLAYLKIEDNKIHETDKERFKRLRYEDSTLNYWKEKIDSRNYNLFDSINSIWEKYSGDKLAVLNKLKYRDTIDYINFVKNNNGYDLSFNHPRLKKSKIANLPMDDSMSFYFFTYYTIRGNWEYLETTRDNFTHNRTREKDNILNGDIARGVYKYYDSLGYTKVWFLRKLTLKRLPCYWLVKSFKDIYFNNENMNNAVEKYDSMLRDGKERFNFEQEAIFANSFVKEYQWEFTYPIDFHKKDYMLSDNYLYIDNLIWRFAEYEILNKPLKKFKNYKEYGGYNNNILTNNFMVKFSDGTYTARVIPFWFYIKKKYYRKWTPPQMK